MESAKKIIKAHGYDNVNEIPMDEIVEVEIDGYDRLVIERVGDDRVSVAHYYEKFGDLMRAPEVVFRVDEDSGEWIPVEYTNDDTGTYKRDEYILGDVYGFTNDWNKNLEKQGFVAAAGGA